MIDIFIVLGDNPGVYEKAAQTEWWPFIPAVGVVMGVCLVMIFITTTVMAMKRQCPVLWTAMSGLIATVILGLSIFGCAVAASRYEERDREHHDLYLAQVSEWVSGEIGGSLAASDAAELLDGESLTVLIDGEPVTLYLKQERSQGVLRLVVSGCDSPTSSTCGAD